MTATDEIIRTLVEADDEADWKELERDADSAPWPDTYAGEVYLFDESGKVVAKSRNLRGIRRYVSRMLVQVVIIQELEHGEGGIKVIFHNNWYWLGRWASFGVLKSAIRNWRNLYGAPLVINGKQVGKIDYRNSALQESDDDSDFKDVYELSQAKGTIRRNGSTYRFEVVGPNVVITGGSKLLKPSGVYLGTWSVAEIMSGGYVGNHFVPLELTWDLRKALGSSLPVPNSNVVRESEDDDSDFKDVYDLDTRRRIYTLAEIKAAEPEFFDRKQMRFFGTKKIYKKGNYIIIKNVRRGHGNFGNYSYITDYVIYEFIPEGTRANHTDSDLSYRGSANNLEDAQEMIKAKDFRSRLDRWRSQLAGGEHGH